MSIRDRVYLFRREGHPTVVVVPTGSSEWVISAQYARHLGQELIRAADQVAAEAAAAELKEKSNV